MKNMKFIRQAACAAFALCAAAQVSASNDIRDLGESSGHGIVVTYPAYIDKNNTVLTLGLDAAQVVVGSSVKSLIIDSSAGDRTLASILTLGSAVDIYVRTGSSALTITDLLLVNKSSKINFWREGTGSSTVTNLLFPATTNKDLTSITVASGGVQQDTDTTKTKDVGGTTYTRHTIIGL